MVKGIGIISAILICLCFYTCKQPDIEKTKTLRFGKMLVLGHGGSGFGIINTPYPANSTESITQAIDFHGADGVEIDVQILKDSVLVVYHDDNFITQTHCEGCVQSKTAEEIKNCCFRKSFVQEKGSAIAFLEDIIAHFDQKPIKPHISINVHLQYDCLAYAYWDDYDWAFARNLTQLIGKFNAHQWIWIESEVPAFLNKIQQLDDQIWLFYIADVSDKNIETCGVHQFKGIVASHHKTTQAAINKARNKGLYISLYNANIRKDIKQAIDKMPDFIQTDNIMLTKQYLKP